MEIGIEGNAPGLDAFDAKSPQCRQELALGRPNAIEERGVNGRLISPIFRRGNRPLQIIYDRQELRRKVGDPVFAGIHHASFGAASRVLDFRQSSEQAVVQGGVRGLNRDGLLAVSRQAFARQMDCVILIIMGHRVIFLAQSAGQRTRRRSAPSACLAMVVVDFLEFRVDHVGIVAGARTLSA